MYKLCYLLIHLFNLCDPLCKVLHLACSPTFTFRAVSTSIVQIKKIMNAALIIINLRSRLGLKIKEQKKGKLMIFSLISQRPGLQLIPDFPSPLFLTHTHTHIQPRAWKLPFCDRRQNSPEHFEKMHLQGHRSPLQVQTFDP